MTFVRLLIATFVAAFACIAVQRSMGWPYWSYFALCAGGAIAAYFINVALIGSYIERRAPEKASRQENASGVQVWEQTAGTGVVPKWVSWIGLFAIGAMLAIPFEVVASLIR